MIRWNDVRNRSLFQIRGALPVLASLLAIRPTNTEVASAIPGLGLCKSTFVKAQRCRLGMTQTG